ncbi:MULTISPECIES: GDSL-type esterase/lipase family protein [Spirulina sp. CCY15215]|uniref:GDSL-type esterase/lipase family protein n=1 Tax=Spirulina sp. CCY15215 TaxID=2767591 RepID=UPI0032AF3268
MSVPWKKHSRRVKRRPDRDRDKTLEQNNRSQLSVNPGDRDRGKLKNELRRRSSRGGRPHLQTQDRSITAYNWSVLSLTANGILLLAVVYLWQQQPIPSEIALANFSGASMQLLAKTPLAQEQNNPSQRLNYRQWVELLAREANSMAEVQPNNLSVLLGDSITLWFNQNFLPTNKTWLNQGISGEKTKGLLRRLHLLDRTSPETFFLMIGINDILAGIGDETILANYRLILQDLKNAHPRTRIIVQSILPHSAEKATWEGRDRLLEIPNERVRHLNYQLQAIAREENALFLDLYPLFADDRGNLRMELSTDGLHLNSEGYKVWSTALKIFDQIAYQ